MKSLPPRLLLTAVSTVLLLTTPLLHAVTEATTDPVGFTTLLIKGTGGTKANELTFVGLGLARPVEYQATAESVSGNTLACTSATWTDGQYANSPQPGYFLEVFSGAKAGLLSHVVTCSATNKTITVADDLSALGVESASVTFKIRRNWSLNSAFGSTNSAGFVAGTSFTADIISIYNPNLGGYDQFYYASSVPLIGTGWRKVGAGSAPQGDAPISLDEGLIVKRVASSDLSITLPGAVKLGQTITTVFPGPNFISNVYPSGVLTLGQTDPNAVPPRYSSNLYTGSESSGVQAGSSTTADLILIYNPTAGSGAGGYDQYYYSNATSGLIGQGWRRVGSGSVDQASTVLPAGKAIYFKRVAASNFNWVMPQPFPTP